MGRADDERERRAFERLQAAFQAVLPALLESPLRGRWVLFAHGRVLSDHATMEDASEALLERWPDVRGVIVAHVVPEAVVTGREPPDRAPHHVWFGGPE